MRLQRLFLQLLSACALVLLSHAGVSAVLTSHAKITTLLSDYGDTSPYIDFIFWLTPSTQTTDLCYGVTDEALEFFVSSGSNGSGVNKAYTLLNLAWLAELPVSLEADISSCTITTTVTAGNDVAIIVTID